MKKIIFVLFVFILATAHSLEIAAGKNTENHTTKSIAKQDTIQDNTGNRRVTLDTSAFDNNRDSEFDSDEYAFVTQLPKPQKPSYQQQYEYLGARMLSALLALQNYAVNHYTQLKHCIKQWYVKQIMGNKTALHKKNQHTNS
jgi:hypothetical protein